MTGASAACASAADQVAAVSVPRPADSHGGRLWLFQFAIPCSAAMVNRLSVFGTNRTNRASLMMSVGHSRYGLHTRAVTNS